MHVKNMPALRQRAASWLVVLTLAVVVGAGFCGI